jgi:hypothetical protein
MPWCTSYVVERGTVTISGSGGLHLEDVQRAAREAARLLREKNSNRLLVDCSEGFLDLRMVDVFYVPEWYDKAGMPRCARIALVLPGAQGMTGMPGLYEFLETVCQNRGYLCRLFDCHESAETWLEARAVGAVQAH